MKIALLIVVLAAAFEALWASHHALRARRAHFRAMVLLFWCVATVLWAGQAWQLLPSGWYFNGVPRFASDAYTYQVQASYVADGLRHGSMTELADRQVFNYSKLVGVVFWLFDGSRLAAVLVNVVFYMASVLCAFLIGRRLFDDRSGLIAAWLAACWPIFLLYETQTLRWVSTTAGLHLILMSTVMLAGRGRPYLPWGCGAVGFAVLLIDMPQFARLAYVMAFALAAVLLIADAGARRWPVRAAQVAAMALLMMLAYDFTWVRASTSAPGAVGGALLPTLPIAPSASAPPPPAIPASRTSFLDRLVAPILDTRSGYLRQNEELRHQGINVGTTLDAPALSNAREFIANIPMALATALVVPTPASLMAARSGASGLGRFVAVEVVIYYALLGLMALGLLQSIRRGGDSMLVTGYLLAFTILAYIIIGTVAMNGGTLHRFRLPYVVVHMVYAAPVLAGWMPRVFPGRVKPQQ